MADHGKESGQRLGPWAQHLGLRFQDTGLLVRALTHRSFAHEAGSPHEQGERLEFLGDSVLGLVISDHLYRTYPHFSEGRMARVRSKVVSEPSLAVAAREIGLGPVLRLGRGERLSGGADRASNLADALESLIGALYIDSGLERCERFVLQILGPALTASLAQADDPKTALQELIQKQYHTTPRYEVLAATGPDHEREFECRVLLDGRELARGSGSARRIAERAAAAQALLVLDGAEKSGQDRGRSE